MAQAAEKLPTWNLSDLYSGLKDDAIQRDIHQLTCKVDDFCTQYKAPFDRLSAKKFFEAIQDYEALEEISGKLHSYADLIYAENMSDKDHSRFYQNMQETLMSLHARLVYFPLAINAMPERVLKEKMKTNPQLRHYQPWLRDVLAFKPYQLSDEMEKLLVEKRVTTQSWVRLFDETIANMRFMIGKEELSSAQALDLLSHKDRKKREQAAKVIGETFMQHADIFTMVTNVLAKDKSIEDSWRGFARPISSRNVANQVEDEVVDALITTVKDNYSQLAHRYYTWKAKQFDVEKLDYWDRNAPLPGGKDDGYNWEEAREIVLSSYAAFSPELAKIGQRFFDENWIDVPPRSGKSPGAFAHPTVPSAHPYLLLNYQGKTRDVMTLAHELGHGVHQVLAADQGALMADTPLTLAETASVFGEMLTFQELLRRQSSKKQKQRLIAGKVEDMLNTVVRQIAFCDFEIHVHDARKNGELSTHEIADIWMKVQKESLGPAIRFEDSYRSYWMYIPHFIHSAFYVYAYAFGDCLVNSLYAVYQQETPEAGAGKFEQLYLDMLRAGGTLRHKELLKPFGLDASKPDFWQQGLSMIEAFIDQLD